jgi:hypothetical protein
MLSKDNPLGFKAVYDVVDGAVGTLDADGETVWTSIDYFKGVEG